MLVAVDAAALTGAQPEQVQSERAQAELGAQALEAVLAVEVEGRERCAGSMPRLLSRVQSSFPVPPVVVELPADLAAR